MERGSRRSVVYVQATRSSTPWLASSNDAEEGPHLVDEQLRLLKSGEVPTARGLVPVADVEEALLRPAARRALELLREDRAAGGHVDRVACGARDPLVDLADALPVQAGRRGARPRKPVEHQIVEQLVARKHALEVAPAVGPGLELLNDPGAERSG